MISRIDPDLCMMVDDILDQIPLLFLCPLHFSTLPLLLHFGSGSVMVMLLVLPVLAVGQLIEVGVEVLIEGCSVFISDAFQKRGIELAFRLSSF